MRDYLHKCGFKSAVLGLSGGIDSALVACLAADALGPENVLGVTMPTGYSSTGSVEDSRSLAERLGIRFLEIPIQRAFETVRAPVYGNLRRPAGKRDGGKPAAPPARD